MQTQAFFFFLNIYIFAVVHHAVCELVLLHLVFFVCFVFVVLLLFFKGGLLSFPAQDNVTLGIGSFA